MVYVDELRNYTNIYDKRTKRHGSSWCHMFADTLDELHEMAANLGLQNYFQDRQYIPHYDLTPNKRKQALELGATVTTTRSWMRRLSAKGN